MTTTIIIEIADEKPVTVTRTYPGAAGPHETRTIQVGETFTTTTWQGGPTIDVAP